MGMGQSQAGVGPGTSLQNWGPSHDLPKHSGDSDWGAKGSFKALADSSPSGTVVQGQGEALSLSFRIWKGGP